MLCTTVNHCQYYQIFYTFNNFTKLGIIVVHFLFLYTFYPLITMAAFDRTTKLIVSVEGPTNAIDIRRTRLPVIRPEETDFDPRIHRKPKNPISLWMAYFNLLRTMCSAGILTMPLAISQSGIVLGPVLCIVVGLLLIHTHHMLLNTLNEISRQLKIPYISYRYGFRLAVLHGPPIFRCIGEWGPQIIAIFMFLSQLGICTVFVTLTSDSVRDIMDWSDNRPALLALIVPYLLLEYFMKTLKIVSYISMLGNFLNLVGFSLIYYIIFIDPDGELVEANFDVMAILLTVGVLLFNLSAVGVILAMDSALKDATRMTSKYGVINIGIGLPTLLSMTFGALGYWSFGTMEENILRVLPFGNILSMVSIGLFLLSVALSYPIQCYPGIAMIMEVIKDHDPTKSPSKKTMSCIESLVRPIFVCMSFIVCYFVPFQGPIVAFVGNSCTSMLTLVFPALMDMCLKYPHHYGKYNFHLFKDLAIIVIGIVTSLFGVYYCGYLMSVRLLALNSPCKSGFY